MSHSIINNTIFWKCITRTLRCIYVNNFNILRFLAEFSTKTKTFLEENIETTRMTPIFSSTFFRLPVCNIHFWIWNSFSCGPPFCPFCCTTIFCQKLLTWTAHYTFLEKRHPEVTKNPYYVLFNRRRQLPISLGSSSWTIKVNIFNSVIDGITNQETRRMVRNLEQHVGANYK